MNFNFFSLIVITRRSICFKIFLSKLFSENKKNNEVKINQVKTSSADDEILIRIDEPRTSKNSKFDI